MDSGIISKERVKQFGEVFTPDSIVCDMIDLVEKQWGDISDEEYISKTYLEPACGDGQFLIRLLERKLKRVKNLPEEQREFALIKAVASIYGVDIQSDNIGDIETRGKKRSEQSSRGRMLKIIEGKEVRTFDLDGKDRIIKVDLGIELKDKVKKAIKSILNANIVVGNTLDKTNRVKMFEYKFNDEGTVQVNEFELGVENGSEQWSKEVAYTELRSLLSKNEDTTDDSNDSWDF